MEFCGTQQPYILQVSDAREIQAPEYLYYGYSD